MAAASLPKPFAASAAVAASRERSRTPILRAHDTRRGILSSLLLASAAALPESESKKALLQEYLKKSRENKAKNDKERLDDYYKRNYKDYFEFLEGTIKGNEGELSESAKGILDWLKANK